MWTTASPRGLTLPPRGCTWADPQLGAAGAATETAGEIGTMGETIETTGGEVLRRTTEVAGEALHRTGEGETTGAGAGATVRGGETTVPGDTDPPTTVCSNF